MSSSPRDDRRRPAAARRAVPLAAAAALVLSARCAPPLASPARAAVRPPAVAGQFYPESPARLEAAVKAYLADAVAARGERPIALVVPHAGYAYSGAIAADAWRQAAGHDYDLIVVLGTHHVAPGFDGVAVYARGGFRTPLGVVEVDSAAAAQLIAADPECRADAAVHEREHSIEVELPFAQVALPGVPILPLVVGSEDPAVCERLGRALAKVLAGRRALLVASSDLAHYPEYARARASDRAMLESVARLDPAGVHRAAAAQLARGTAGLVTAACGEAPVMAALAAARELGATRGVVLSWANSGDTSFGDWQRVVGYGAVMLTAGAPGADLAALEPPPAPPAGEDPGPAARRQLLGFARRTLERALTTDTAPLARGMAPEARRLQGAFVTLRERGALRGCIGTMGEDQPLDQVVGRMTLAAAFQDPRFPPVTRDEASRIEIEISALTPLTRVAGPEAVVIGRDGVRIHKNGRVGVFLPEVPVEEHWDRTALMENLCLKAGLPRDAWKSGADLYTFRSIHFAESGSR